MEKDLIQEFDKESRLTEILIHHIDHDDNESAVALLTAYSADDIKKILFELPAEYKLEAFLLLPKDLGKEVIKCGDEDLSTYFIHDLRSAQISEAVEYIYADNFSDAVTDLPSFAVQKILTNGTPAARKIIARSIASLVATKRLAKLREVLIELNPVDIAGIIDDFKDQDLLKLFRLMPKDMASDVFVYLPQEINEQLINLMSDSEAGQIIDDLHADDAVDLIDEMPAKVVKKLLAHAKPETRAAINHLLQYKDDSAGSIMTVEFVDLKEDYTVKQAIQRIRRDGVDKETINNCYVLDAKRRLLGMVSLRKLLLSSQDEIVGKLMEENVIVVRTNTDQEEVAQLFKKYGFTSLPVCDSENRLVGIVTIDDIVNIIHEEALEDISLINKVTPSDTEYLKTPVWRIWLNRVPWLLILMISATFTGLIISYFEDQLLLISSALFVYVPMLMDTGGNAGNQSSVTIIRGMALGEIDWKDKYKVVWKEIRASLILGASVGIVCFAKVLLVDQFIYNAETFYIGEVNSVVQIAAIISAAVFIAIFIAKFVGAILPMASKKIKLDPAVVASPFITTIVDALALLIYCYIAIAFLG